MKLNIRDEYSPLQAVAVCYAKAVPEFKDYHTDDPQELIWNWQPWDKRLMLQQQDYFFKTLQKFGAQLIELDTSPELPHQMYTRDTAFVIGQKLFFAENRTLIARHGEKEKLLEKINLEPDKVLALPGKIEGGDVIIDEVTLVGLSNRTNQEAVTALSQHVNLRALSIGDKIMHMDTRFTLLPNKYALADLTIFTPEDLSYIQNNYTIIDVSSQEAKTLGTNIFIINPETICLEASQLRIKDKLIDAGFNVEMIPYSEPIAFGGSLRCTTMPLRRM